MATNGISTLRLILWPSLLTLAVNCARLTAEVQGWVTAATGGRLAWLGISWLMFVFGAWFGWRLRRAGAPTRVAYAPVWPTFAVACLIGAIMWQFGPLVEADQSDKTFAQLRQAVLVLVGIATALALTMFAIWPRLAWTMLCYAIPARATVVALTWLAKSQGWDTHYTKFGPPGIERDMTDTMISASVAQGGFWVPFTIVAGTFAGSWFGRHQRR